MKRAIEDNDPSDGEVSLENCVAQGLVIWWLSSNRPAVWKSSKVKQGIVKLHMPGIHSCLVKRHPTLDPDTQNNNSQKEPQPGPSGQMSKKPDKYQTMEYIVLHLKSYEFDFFKELSKLIRHQRMHMVFHVLLTCLTLLLPTSAMIMEMFRDLELYGECEEVIEIFPEMIEDGRRIIPTSKKVHMGTKLLKKGHKVKSSITTDQGHCSSTSPLNSIRENGETEEVEGQMPELVDTSDDGDTNGDQQSLITFGQAQLTNMSTFSEKGNRRMSEK